MRKLNLVGQKFERLLVIKEVSSLNSKESRPSWECLCDCGKIVVVRTGYHLTSGNSRSCGCLKAELASERLLGTSHRKQFDPVISSARGVFKHRYANDGDTLSFEEFYKLSQMNCFYCGIFPKNEFNVHREYNNSSQKTIENGIFIYNGLDRVDNNMKHSLNNCVPCCGECNLSKRNMSINQFLQMIINIVKINHHIPNYNILFTLNEIDLSSFKKIKGSLNRLYKDIDFSFELLSFILSQNCFYCGGAPLNQRKCKNGDIIIHNGLDRLDQTKDHLLENIVTCCKFCNWSKTKRSCKEFKSWAKRVYLHFIANNKELFIINGHIDILKLETFCKTKMKDSYKHIML